MITAGTCQMNSMYPILHLTTCEEAAKQLGLTDMVLSIGHTPDRPEGCYFAHNKKLQPQLWMGMNPLSKGKGAETSTSLVSRHPICAPTAEIGKAPLNPKLDTAVGFQTKQAFYVYHDEADTDDGFENINAGDLPGLLWHLHTKVVVTCPRKFGITRVRRIKITMQNTYDLYNDSQTQFGPYLAFWHQKCFTRGCEDYYRRYGGVVGCQTLPYRRGAWGAYCSTGSCRPGHLYSLPGPCPAFAMGKKPQACKKELPGGSCKGKRVTGTRDCTYRAEDAGVVLINEVTGIGNYDAFCKAGGLEYNRKTDRGKNFSFWDGMNDKTKCGHRLYQFLAHFKKKYPDQPVSLGEQECDWTWSDPM